MNAAIAPLDSAPSRLPQGPLLRTLVLCDLVDSTALVERLGDQAAAALMRSHDRLARDLLHRHGGQEIDRTDGFLLMFARPSEGTAFALDYQRELRRLGAEPALALRARVGVHVGDVLLWENSADDVAHGAKLVEVEGLVKPVVARLAGLARPGQILLSGVAATLAQRGETDVAGHGARWLNHGRYRFKGIPEPLPIYEIGEPGIAPLAAPPWSSKAHREVPWWRRPASVAVEISLLAGALAASAWWVFRPPPAIAFAQRDWVVLGSLTNLTRDSRFDDSLQTAFRIGLEQSRFVNVLSDLQVRDALGRMRREPSTLVDRAVGAEIALREGARAVILPSVAEVGGKLRINAEIVDPATQATVYTDSAEGNGSESALSSLDAVNQAVRAKLGESLASVKADGAPLPKVTSTNLDALRAYALGAKAFLGLRYSEALSLFDQALALDPQFATARLGKARVYLSSGDRASALRELEAAAPLRERLPPREALYFDALLSTFRSPPEMLEKWKVLGNLYPDLFFAHTNYALFAWQCCSYYAAAIEELQHSFDPHNSSLGASHYLMSTLYLATDRIADARAEMKAALESGRPAGLVTVELDAAQRRLAAARRAAQGLKDSGLASDGVFHFFPLIEIAVDSGDRDDVEAQLRAAQSAAASVGPLYSRLFEGVALSLHTLDGSATPDALEGYAAREAARSRDAGDTDAAHAAYAASFGAYLLAASGETRRAGTLLDSLGEVVQATHTANVERMFDVARAEVMRRSGKPQQAIDLLGNASDGAEPYLAHVVLEQAFADLQRWADALDQTIWLTGHRGRAYGEFGSLYLQRPYYVARSTLAWLEAAEIAERSGDRPASRRYLAQLQASWPNSPLTDARVKALQARLGP